jgi:O-antigen ligase
MLLILALGVETRTVDIFGTFLWRVDQWTDTFRMIIDRPTVLILGHGTVYLEQEFSRFAYPNPHNALLYFLIEYGVVGLALFSGFLCAVLSKVYHAAEIGKGPFNGASKLATAICTGLIVLLCMMLADDFFVQTQLSAIFFFYLGLARNLTTSR